MQAAAMFEDVKTRQLKWKISEYAIEVKNPALPARGGGKASLKPILSNVEGVVSSGDFLAIMGPSGAGKTTLLSLLCDRIHRGRGMVLKKKVTFGRHMLTQQNFGKIAAYVMQDDRLFATLTPRECIEFVVNLRIKASREFKCTKVNQVLEELGLLKCADTLVGDHQLKGISGGERKRVSIAVELVTDPLIVFLDEPTSGLDTITAYAICKRLRALANKGRIVVCTIHQPTAETFFLFNKLTLLAKGQVVYHGDTKNSVGYFDSIGYSCPQFLNAIEYFMKVMQPNGNEEDAATVLHDLASNYQKHKRQLAASSSTSSETGELKTLLLPFHKIDEESTTPPSIWMKLFYLTKRAVQNVVRHRPLIVARVSSTIVMALITLAVWSNSSDDRAGVNDKMGLFIHISLEQFMSAVQSVSLSFPVERNVFLKEYSSGLYGIVPYFIAKNLPETFYQLVFPLLYSSISYYGMGLQPDFSHFLWFILTMMLLSLTGASFGFFLGCGLTDPQLISLVGLMAMMPFILTAGFFANVQDLGPWISWVQYFSPLRYSYEALARNEFEGRDVCEDPSEHCDPISDYSLTFGFGTSLQALIMMAIGYRLLALFVLKHRAQLVG